MHNESDIKRAVKILLEAYGSLDTTEVKQHLEEVLVFDEDDLQPSTTRNGEPLVIQRIGNVVSHQLDQIYYYPEGFLVDKTREPALWFLTTGLPGSEETVNANSVNRLRTRLGQQGSRRYKKIDWDRINERNTFLGHCGEEFVYLSEFNRVRQMNPFMLDRVQHLSAHQGDGFGYDVLSVDENGESLLIEVKTTQSRDPLTPFYMSINEHEFFKDNVYSGRNNAYIYRVYDFNDQSREGKILIIPAKALLDDFCFDPVSFRVYKRGY